MIPYERDMDCLAHSDIIDVRTGAHPASRRFQAVPPPSPSRHSRTDRADSVPAGTGIHIGLRIPVRPFVFHRNHAHSLFSRRQFIQHLFDDSQGRRSAVRIPDRVKQHHYAVYGSCHHGVFHPLHRKQPKYRSRPAGGKPHRTKSVADAAPYHGRHLNETVLPHKAEKLHKILSRTAFPALILLATIFFIQHHATITAQFGKLGLCISILILLAMGGGALLSGLMHLNRKERRTLIIEIGMQNAAQAIAIASSPFVFNNDIIAIPAIIYALMMNIILLGYVGIVKRR